MAGRRHNGGIVGVLNTTSQSSAKGRFSLNEVQRALKGGVWPGWSPSVLFAAGEQGVWYDPSDFSTMFQDSAGTTPVTAIEQPVGRILDKSGRGNHASQSTTTSRPILRNLYNLLAYTEQFDNEYWVKGSEISVTANSTTAPNGTTTADTITTNNVAHSLWSGSVVPYVVVSPSTAYVFSFYVKRGTMTDMKYSVYNYTAPSNIIAPTSYYASTSANWVRIEVSFTTPAGCTSIRCNPLRDSGVTGDVYIWGASLVPADQAHLPYQRVVTNTLGSGVYDTDTTKFKPYLRADRTDDSYTTTDGGGSTTGFFFCASILLQTAGQTHTLISDTGTNTGYRVRINSSNQLELSAGNGSAYTTATTTDTLATGQMAVITAWHDGTKLYAQINNGAIAEQAFGTATAGTAALTIGKDNGAASNYFGGGIYAHVYRKNVAPDSTQREQTKRYCAQKAIISL